MDVAELTVVVVMDVNAVLFPLQQPVNLLELICQSEIFAVFGAAPAAAIAAVAYDVASFESRREMNTLWGFAWLSALLVPKIVDRLSSLLSPLFSVKPV